MDSSTFQQTILPLYRPMLALAMSLLGDADAARDAVQDTVATLWERHRRLEITVSASALCLRAVRNRCLTILRDSHPGLPLDAVSARAVCQDAMAVEEIWCTIALLPQRQRLAVTLSLQGYSAPEIARRMGVTEANARQLLSRGRCQLRLILSRQ